MMCARSPIFLLCRDHEIIIIILILMAKAAAMRHAININNRWSGRPRSDQRS